MSESDRINLMLDKHEIQSLLTRYCTSIDSKQYDGLDTVFTPDAYIDYSASGGTTGKFPEVKAWLAEVLAMFSMTQHVIANFEISVNGDEATSRCVFYNPMQFANPEDTKPMFWVGGYYNDKLVRTSDGWRIRERVEDMSWNFKDAALAT